MGDQNDVAYSQKFSLFRIICYRCILQVGIVEICENLHFYLSSVYYLKDTVFLSLNISLAYRLNYFREAVFDILSLCRFSLLKF
jgi:hypothetical protein